MSQHLLPCEQCGQAITVSVSMAGRAVACPHCGASVTAPKMGLIRQLPLAEQPIEKRRRREWSTTNGALFALGFVLLIAGSIGATYWYLDYQQHQGEILKFYPDGQIPDFSDVSTFEASVSQLSVSDLWDQWREALKETLAEWNPTVIRDLLDKRETAWNAMIRFAVSGGIGLFLCGLSLVPMGAGGGRARPGQPRSR